MGPPYQRGASSKLNRRDYLHPAARVSAAADLQLPVAVSGGFSTGDDTLAGSGDWGIAIVGRGIADAVAPADMAHQLTSIVRKIHTEEGL
ncbi:hypothetical protein [Nocardia amamiensis]|uniref:hypothetical protein n=1 Tax=Nocardia amamiensis TaxID=404578 RepID=UPI00082DB985|nr:hypothetical protein [Nocardia amamiensis]